MDPAPMLHRAFLALWPDVAARQALAALPLPAGARAVAAEDLHLTLAFLGDVQLPDPQAFVTRCAALGPGPLKVQLDALEYWAGPGVLCATGGYLEVAQRVARLAAPLQAQGLPVERRPFRAHVTLARQVTAKDAGVQRLAQPLSWTAGSIVLAASGAGQVGRRYHIVASAPL